MSEYHPTKKLGVNLTDNEFHLLCGYARKYKMPISAFLAFMVRSYLESAQKTDIN